MAYEQCQKPIIFFFFYWEEGMGRGEETKIMMIKYIFIFFAFMYNTIYDKNYDKHNQTYKFRAKFDTI